MHARLLTLILVAVVSFPSCGGGADPQAREKELSYLRSIMPDTLLDYAHVEVPALENIALLGEGAKQHLGLHVFPGQKKRNGGIRAEVSVDYPCKQGDTVRYEWRFRVPPDFVSDAPKNRWWIIGQWHDQPNHARGESWDGFASKSPPVLLGLGEIEGRLAFGFEYGPTLDQKLGPFFIKRGTWHRVAMVITWSQKADGAATLFLNDMTQPVAKAKGPNMHNDYQHYLKLGMYRHPEIQTDNWIYLDDLRITVEKKGP